MREVMKQNGVDALVIWMSVLSFFFVVVLAAMFASLSRALDRIAKRLDKVEQKVMEKQNS